MEGYHPRRVVLLRLTGAVLLVLPVHPYNSPAVARLTSEKTGTERLSNLPKVTQLRGSHARICCYMTTGEAGC